MCAYGLRDKVVLWLADRTGLSVDLLYAVASLKFARIFDRNGSSIRDRSPR